MSDKHREPTICHANGRKEWFKDGELHRLDGPAIEHPNGTQIWYRRGKCHRDDGPAVLNADGTRAWYRDGKLHRTDGPAVESPNGVREWWVDGVTVAPFPFRADVFDLKVAAASVVREMSYHTASISNEGNAALKRLADVLANENHASERLTAERAAIDLDAVRAERDEARAQLEELDCDEAVFPSPEWAALADRAERAEAGLAEACADRDMWKREHDASTEEGVRAEIRARAAESRRDEALSSEHGYATEASVMRRERDAAEAGLAALRERVERLVRVYPVAHPSHRGPVEMGCLDEVRGLAVADTAAAAEAYTRRVEAKALREAADEIDRGEIPGRDSRWLRNRAAEIDARGAGR